VADDWLGADKVVSADRLRGVVGAGEDDVSASKDAFEVLDLIVQRRLARGLTTVVDTLGYDTDQRAAWRALADRHRVPVIAITFLVDAAEARRAQQRTTEASARERAHGQLRRWPGVLAELAAEPFAAVHDAQPVELVPANLLTSSTANDSSHHLKFGLQIPAFQFAGGPAVIAERLTAIAEAAEEAGFEHLWVLDHFRQIPMFAPAWHDLPESYTTLAYLAAVTSRIPPRLVGHRAHLPPPRPPRQDRRQPRRAVRRPRHVRPRPRVVPRRARCLRHRVPSVNDR
jgi:predicted kinase